MFWLHDAYHVGDGFSIWRKCWFQAALALITVLIGAFICVAGLYVNVKGIADAYASGLIPNAFSCSAA